MKSYLLYLLKKRIPVVITYSVILFVIYLSFSVVNIKDMILVAAISLCGLCVITPIIEFSFKMNKLSAHQAYSFPISRRNLYLTRYIIGFIELIIPFIAISFPFMIINEAMVDGGQHAILVIFELIIPASVLYSYFVFFFTRANSMLDGVVILLLSIASPMAILFLVCKVTEPFNPTLFETYDSLSIAGTPFSMVLAYVRNISGFDRLISICMVIFYYVLGVASIVFFVLSSKQFSNDDVGHTTESWFGYRTLLPILAFYSVINVSWVIVVLYVVGLYFGCALYTRKLTSKKLWLLFAVRICCLTIGLVVSGLISDTATITSIEGGLYEKNINIYNCNVFFSMSCFM